MILCYSPFTAVTLYCTSFLIVPIKLFKILGGGYNTVYFWESDEVDDTPYKMLFYNFSSPFSILVHLFLIHGSYLIVFIVNLHHSEVLLQRSNKVNNSWWLPSTSWRYVDEILKEFNFLMHLSHSKIKSEHKNYFFQMLAPWNATTNTFIWCLTCLWS